PVALGPLRASRARLGLPVHAAAEKELGRSTVAAEVQVFTAGTLALVMLPGEPFQKIALAIQERDPFAHTLALGYANGKGVGYVALSEDPRDGGYRLARPVGWGADEAGRFLVATAVRLLQEHAAGQP